uniref:ORF43d n=1 Tax=Pinus thunbergii TaxID=3350 RepID=Q32996_PINTH|nr:ORF43d [Pinus thunbergii]
MIFYYKIRNRIILLIILIRRKRYPGGFIMCAIISNILTHDRIH